ncbi:MAG: cell division protein ZapA [Nitrospirae bacterium]|nr:MAG: cell division protein ZapA [Nitrospirota bacterium]
MGTVEFTILGQKYRIKGDATDEYILSLASFVEGQIKEVIEANPNISPLKASILASFNIADELFRYRREQEDLKKGLESKAEQLVRLFE